MSFPLAIVTPEFGTPTQTFVRRHVEDLLPRRTAVVTQAVVTSASAHWTPQGPLLELRRLRPGLMRRGIASAARRAGRPLRAYSVSATKRFLREHKVEVVMAEHLDTAIDVIEVARELGIRFFGHAHGYDVSLRLRNPEWRDRYLQYNDAAGVITVSRFSQTRLVSIGLDAAKVHVVPCGVDVPDTLPVPVQTGQMDRQGIRCVAVGRMVGKKAPTLMLEAFRRALTHHPNLRLDVVGGGALLPAAEQFVRSFHLESAVTLHGVQSHEFVLRLMQDADVFLQHSITNPTDGNEEGLPVAILEAMAHALPVVSTRHAGIPEAVQDGVTGHLVEEGDSAGMADHLIALARDAGHRRALGAAGWTRARERFSWERERAHLIDVLGLTGH